MYGYLKVAHLILVLIIPFILKQFLVDTAHYVEIL